MKNQEITRRDFVKLSMVGGVTTALLNPSGSVLAQAAASDQGICITLCNHWSYIGIGWQLGIESCVLSAEDAMGMADRSPHVKTCLELDARAYEFMAEKFPEVAERLKKYLAEDKVELIGGTYSQPLGTMFSGESNIRQLVYGRNTIRKALNYEVATFLDEEEFSHPQIPQIALGAGYTYASLAQVDTWGRAGIPYLEVNAFHWKGLDGVTIPCIPKNSLFGYSPDLIKLATSGAFKKLRVLGKPLLFTWEEFGWEPPEQPSYLKTPEKYQKISEQFPVEFVTLKDYLDRYGSSAAMEPVYFNMDAWNKLLTWGLGGDQLRIMDREVEAKLLAAERFDALAASLGGRNHAIALEKAWKDFLTSQSHDVGLCEYSRWQGDRMAPLDRIEDKHNFTWGALGYNHLSAAEKQGEELLTNSLDYLSGRINSEAGQQGPLAVTVFNPCSWERSDLATTGRVIPPQANIKDIVVKDGSGRRVPSQIIKRDKDDQGNLRVANVAFQAGKVPSVGYDTYYLEFAQAVAPPASTDLRIDEPNLMLENEYLKVHLSPSYGAIVSLIDKRTGREVLDGNKGAFPVFRGNPNQDYGLFNVFARMKYHRKELKIPASFDSSLSKAAYEGTEKLSAPSGQMGWDANMNSSIRWVEKGPLRATVKTHHDWPLLKFETYITLCAGSPSVEVISRVLTEIPPAPDALGADGRFPAEIKQGYWLTFAPGFDATSVVRDFPLGIESTERPYFQARTFVDLVGADGGLLVVHPGTQYFKREAGGVFSNLIMREWESYFSAEYGWPRYSEYRHALRPHSGSFTHADRVRAADEFSQKLITVVGKPQKGTLPLRKSFITVQPENAHLMVFRQKEQEGFEIRVLETAGGNGAASIELAIPAKGASETDLQGKKVGEVTHSAGKLSFDLKPWRVRTFEVV
jgi:alpha-mannosidase